MGIVSIIFGILALIGIPLTWIPLGIGWILNLGTLVLASIGTIFGIIGLVGPTIIKGPAIAGTVISLIALVYAVNRIFVFF
jgi:hypothetical protein